MFGMFGMFLCRPLHRPVLCCATVTVMVMADPGARDETGPSQSVSQSVRGSEDIQEQTLTPTAIYQ